MYRKREVKSGFQPLPMFYSCSRILDYIYGYEEQVINWGEGALGLRKGLGDHCDCMLLLSITGIIIFFTLDLKNLIRI